jgi:predicted phage terminase large subunit-like protein
MQLPTSSASWLELVRSNPALRKAATPRLNRYIPHTPFPKQAAWLLLGCREAFYGGSAGPGKSEALLMAALQYVDVPGYAALLLRRTYADLSKPGALMDRARTWLQGTDAVWRGDAHTWRFPSGAVLAFGYLEQEGSELQYQSAEFQYVGFDELTQFGEAQYRYLFSRLRRLEGAGVPIRMRAASNPGGPGHDWVKARFIDGKAPGRVFIRAMFKDNPHIDQAAYRAALAELPPVTRKQLEDGDWDVRQEGALAQREWFPVVDVAPAQARRVRAWDMAATERSAKSADPDYSVGLRMSVANGVYYVEHIIRERLGAASVMATIRQTAQADGVAVAVNWEQEGGSSGKIVADGMSKTLAGYTFQGVPVHKDKVTRAMPFFAQAQAGNVRLVRGAWCSAFLDEMASFPQGAHDDIVDACSLAFSSLQHQGWSRGPAA